jgi:hypothetical protein
VKILGIVFSWNNLPYVDVEDDDGVIVVVVVVESAQAFLVLIV